MKLYKLSFCKYTNPLKDTVAANNSEMQPKYITCDSNGFLYVAINNISQLEHFNRYGGGIRFIDFLGGVIVLDEASAAMNNN